MREAPPPLLNEKQKNEILDITLLQALAMDPNSYQVPCRDLTQIGILLAMRNRKYYNRKCTHVHHHIKATANEGSILASSNQQKQEQEQEFVVDREGHAKLMDGIVEDFMSFSMNEGYELEGHGRREVKQTLHFSYRQKLQLQSLQHSLLTFFTHNDPKKFSSIALLDHLSVMKQSIIESPLTSFLTLLQKYNYQPIPILKETCSKVSGLLEESVWNKQCCGREYSERSELLFWMVMAGEVGREGLKDLLYLEGDKELFGIVSRYDEMLVKGVPVDEEGLRDYQDTVEQWVNKDNKVNKVNKVDQDNWRKAIGIILHPGYQSLIELQQIKVTPFNQNLLLMLQTLRWLSLNLSPNNNTFHKKKIKQFTDNRKAILKKLSNLPQIQINQRLSINFNMFNISEIVYEGIGKQSDLFLEEEEEEGEGYLREELKKIQRVMMMAVLMWERNRIQGVMALLDPYFDYVRLEREFMGLLRQFVTNSCGVKIVVAMFPFLTGQQQRDLLLHTKQTVEQIPWQSLMTVLPPNQLSPLIQDIIFTSIQRYHNASSFISFVIPQKAVSPFFQIDIMIKGFTQIILGEVGISQPDRNKYFSMISMFRGEEIPEEYLFKMIQLEMLFELFLLREFIQQRNGKEIINSLTYNLEEYEENQQIPFMTNSMSGRSLRNISHNTHRSHTRMTASSSHRNLHNNTLLHQIWQRRYIIQLTQFTMINLFIGYINSLMDGIMLVMGKFGKSVRRSKVEIWIGSLDEKIRDAVNFTGNSTFRVALNRKREDYVIGLEKIANLRK